MKNGAIHVSHASGFDDRAPHEAHTSTVLARLREGISLNLLIIVLLTSFLFSLHTVATPNGAGQGALWAAEHAEKAPDSELKSDDDDAARPGGKKRTSVRYLYSIGVPSLVFAYAFSTWGWAKRDYWKWSHEGWFGHGTHYGGFDKTGHVFTHYSMMRMSCSLFNYTEKGSRMRFLYGALITLLMGLSIEIGDAYSGYGFSYHDLVADSTGIIIGGLLEAFPKADAFVSLSIQYWPSAFFRKNPRKILLMPDDFSGMIVMANFKFAGFREVGVKIPSFLRYLMIDVGYGTRGYTSYDRRAAWDHYRYSTRSQNLYVGVSINFMEVVRDFFKDPGSLGCRATQQFFKYYHIPAGYSHRIILNSSENTPRSLMRPSW